MEISNKACDFCHKRKRKCVRNGSGNCKNCSLKGIQCKFSPRSKRGPKVKETNLSLVLLKKNPGDFEQTSLPKKSRLSPSPATGLLGFEENVYLNIYLQSDSSSSCIYGKGKIQKMISLLFVRGNNIAVSRMLHNELRNDKISLHFGPNYGMSSAELSVIWSSIATGALIKGASKNFIQKYLDYARESIKSCYNENTIEALQAYLVLAKLNSLIEDFSKFFYYLGNAINIAKHLHRTKCDELLSEDLWIFLEAMKYMKNHIEEMKKKYIPGDFQNPFGDLICPDNADFHDILDNEVPRTSLVCYAPHIDGLSSYNPFIVQTLIERDNCMSTNKARKMTLCNVIASSLTHLSEPDAVGINSLVNVATIDKTNFLPVTLTLDYRIEQIMNTMVEKSIERARIPARRIKTILDRIVEHTGADFMGKLGMIQLKLVAEISLVELILGNEERCLEYVRVGVRMVVKRPGLARFPAWRHNIKGFGALLISANLEKEYNDLKKAYNGLNMANGTDVMLDYEDDSWQWRSWGKYIYHIIQLNMFENLKNKKFFVRSRSNVNSWVEDADAQNVVTPPTSLEFDGESNGGGNHKFFFLDFIPPKLQKVESLDPYVYEILDKEF
eukprot:CAMPEP_0171460830 /NCGR_PEP_ID=MMETSP0945-20130129/5545_1 /TAXON_ID=109269 /ORGANISM="Vaucheria litorea, Strain CCMP2940" /LENGTH=612 /DNA_ID=CAMNT_0011987103 /DNA_START=87 /DNA_END=1925 /DNA_ORIENTATION=+